MAKIAFDAQTPREKKNTHYIRVSNTGRASPRIPDLAPYNFGINRTWFDKYKNHPEYRSLLVDWYKYADPAGLGTNGMQAGEVERVVDAPQLTVEDDSEANAASE